MRIFKILGWIIITFLEFCLDDSYLDHGPYPCFCRDHDPVIWILIGDPEILNNKINVDIILYWI